MYSCAVVVGVGVSVAGGACAMGAVDVEEVECDGGGPLLWVGGGGVGALAEVHVFSSVGVEMIYDDSGTRVTALSVSSSVLLMMTKCHSAVCRCWYHYCR